MSDNVQDNTNAATAQPTGQEPAGNDNQNTRPQTGKKADLPDWVRKEISDANEEAAKYRVQLRELEARFANAKSLEEYEALARELAEVNKKNAKLERDLLLVTLSEGLPPEAKAALASHPGDAEALKKFAETLRKLIGSGEGKQVENLGGGLTPGTNTETFDAAAIARKILRR